PTTLEAGTFAIRGSGSISNTIKINVGADALLDVSGRNGGGMTLADGQTLGGSGSVMGNLTVGSGSTLAQYDAPGALTFANALTLGAGGTCVVRISKPPVTNYAVRVLGNLGCG